MQTYDDTLIRFEAEGALRCPRRGSKATRRTTAPRIWYASYGSGRPVILLHGGMGNAGNWGYQLPALLAKGYRVILVDSRGHGRSTWDGGPFSYDQMAADVIAVMDRLAIDRAALIGWSDGACAALVLASALPRRVAGVFFFGCNMDPTGVKEIEFTPVLQRCVARHRLDYEQFSSTQARFEEFSGALSLMQSTQPNYTAEDLERIRVPVTIAQSEFDEFIKPEHAEYLARTIPGAEYVYLPGVSHFAPLQRPDQFNAAALAFLTRVYGA